jgi:hypothetical protein
MTFMRVPLELKLSTQNSAKLGGSIRALGHSPPPRMVAAGHGETGGVTLKLGANRALVPLAATLTSFRSFQLPAVICSKHSAGPHDFCNVQADQLATHSAATEGIQFGIMAA